MGEAEIAERTHSLMGCKLDEREVVEVQTKVRSAMNEPSFLNLLADQPGSMPIFLMADAASGALRCLTNALAASGEGAATCSPAA